MSVQPHRSVSVNLGLAYLGPRVQTAVDVVYQDSGALLVFKSIKLGVVALLLAACTVPGARPRHAAKPRRVTCNATIARQGLSHRREPFRAANPGIPSRPVGAPGAQ